jgi:TonB family protein
MINYLIELTVVHVALFFGYWLFLRKEQQYARMRSYLVAATLLALAIPLLKLPKLFSFSHEPLVIMSIDAMPMEAIPTDTVPIAPAAAASAWGYELMIWTHITVSSFFLLKFLIGIVYLVCLEGKSRREKVNGLTIRRAWNIKGSFTFFNWIFLSDEIDPRQPDYEVILKHEKAHGSLGHTYDLIFFELFKACFWWLPTAWIVVNETKKIHEYQADAVAIKTCDVDRYSSILISSTLKTNGLNLPAEQRQARWQAGLASSFHDGLILKRLEAMKQQTKNVSPWKLAALTVLCASLVIALACSEEKSIDKEKEEIFTVVEAYPEFEGGVEAFYNYIQQEMTYPLQARQAGVEGRVDVEFVVDKDGSISDVEAIKGIGAGCDKEAVRVVKSLPPFKPATQNGKPARARMVVPVVFDLKPGQTNPDKSAQGIVTIEKIQSRNYKLTVEARYENREWIGTVYDKWSDEMPGANIVVPGTTTGTTSAQDGTFKLKADEGHGIVVSFVGYETVAVLTSWFDQPKNWPDVYDQVSKDNRPRYREHQH